MIDVNKITSTLAKLPDAQLQQYAQMHKNDPYIMALAMSESNRRKELRSAGQGAQGMQEQPKVVDREIAQMAPQQLPENQGIGQLPAGDMNFADGGIIAFADGGDVERFNGSQSQFVQDIMGIPQQYTEYQQRIRESDRIKAEREKEMAQRRQDELAARQKTRFANYLFGSPEREAEGKAELAQLATTPVGAPARSGSMPEPGYTRPGMLYDPRLNTPSSAPASTSGAAPTADTTRRAGPGAGLGAAAAAAAPKDDPFSMSSIRKAQDEALGESRYQIGALNNQLVEIRNKADTQVQQRLDDRKKEIEAEGDVYKDRSDRLVARGKELAGQKDQNTGLALLNAGLAIMSTPGGLMTAIGKGAQVGTAQYAAGIKDLRAAQERLDEANDRIAELRLNRKDLNSREIRALEKDRDAAILDGQKMVFGFAKDIYGMDRKQAEAAFTSYMSGQEKKAAIAADRENTLIREGGANARNKVTTDATLQNPERMAYMSALEKTKTKEKPQGDPAAAYQSIVAMKADPRSQEKLRGDWLDMAKRMQIQADYPNIKTFEDYVTVFGGGAGSAGGGGDGFKVVGVRPAK
jgi:hypothetical protein